MKKSRVYDRILIRLCVRLFILARDVGEFGGGQARLGWKASGIAPPPRLYARMGMDLVRNIS